jgi:hypothetical protein
VDRADRLDRVGLLRTLVGPVPLDPCEAKRNAARIARAALDAVERDLDDQLRADMDDVADGRPPVRRASALANRNAKPS